MHQSAIYRPKNPRETKGAWSIWTLLFTAEIFRKSLRRDLQERDIYCTLGCLESDRLGDKLEQQWNLERKLGRKSLTRALFRTFGKDYLYLGFANLVVKSTISAIKPLALGKFITYFSIGSTMSQSEAFLYAFALIGCKLVYSFFVHHYQLQMSTYGLRMRVALCSLIYRKSLKLTEASLQDLSNGKLVTVITKDIQVFDSAINFFNDIWLGLVQLVIMTVIMYNQIQESAFLGIGLLVSLIPLQVFIAKFATRMRLRTAAKTDERLKRIQEVLTSIKLLKYYGWEDYYTKITNQLRKLEMKSLRIIYLLKGTIFIISGISQRISLYLCLLFYMFMGNYITAEKMFVVLECYGNLRFLIGIALPLSVFLFAECRSSMKRLKECLMADDVDQIHHREMPTKEVKILCKNVFVKFDNKLILQDVNFENQSSGELIAVTGAVGSGKTTFLKILLKDLDIYSGVISTFGKSSYASQEPWLFPGTIRQNIIFGLDFDPSRYQKVINCCCLTRDLKSFPNGDDTIVNDKGLNLSKGQQARINLARAIYKKCDIYLLDDVMVSLDATVSEELFQKCFLQFLKDKLIVFVCHNKKYLKLTSRILYFQNGTIEGDGTYSSLREKGFQFTSANIDHLYEDKEKNHRMSQLYDVNMNSDENPLLQPSKNDTAHIYGEKKVEGKVSRKVYLTYLKSAGGYGILVLVLAMFIVSHSFAGYFDYYVKKWVTIEENLSYLRMNLTIGNSNLTRESPEYVKAELDHYNGMVLYSCLVAAIICSYFVQFFSFFFITARASTNLHNTVFAEVTKATLTFFDRNLSGNIVNRFSKDIGVIDENLPMLLFDSLRISFICISIAVVISFINIKLVIPTLCVFAFVLILRQFYATVTRSLKRLDGITRAPIVGFLNSTLQGLTTIRASEVQEILKSQFDKHQDHNSSVSYMLISCSRSFAFWLDMICIVYLTGMMLYFIFFLDTEQGNAGAVGVTLTQAFGLMGLLQWCIRQWTEVENCMTSVERISEYQGAEKERLTGLDPDNWPTKGLIEYRNVGLDYFDGQPVLKNISFTVNPGERIGIIGRTGAGKSSIISALFRLYKIRGKILIDDLDIKDIELKVVRSKIAIIPQDPILFGGTIRSNLDPYGDYTDQNIWRALEEVKLKGTVEELNAGLMTEVHEGGSNFSVGQRQLICLARAVLRDNKILVLDEATANIDPQTDALLQTTIKRLFSHCTIMTIAHRLHTIIDSDRILVVDNGSIVQYDTPKKLFDDKEGIFYNMASQAGLSVN